MTRTNLNKVTLWTTFLFGFIWIILIGLDYGNKHPGYYFSFSYFRYTGLIFSLTIITLGSYLIYLRRMDSKGVFKIRGIYLYFLILFFFWLIIFFNRHYGETESSIGDLFQFWITATFNCTLLLIFFHIMRSFGQLLRKKLFHILSIDSMTIDTSIGIMSFTMLMFIIGALGLLKATSVLLLLFIIVVLNVTYFVKQIKVYLFKPFDINRLNIVGWASFSFILFFLALNFLSTIIPYPAGFDSRNLYVNISKIIGETGGLASGFQPYNWSLLMSVGFIMFDYVELALGISFAAIVLVLFGIYELGVKFLKINENFLKFLLCMFIVTPALVNQMFVEFKVDFGLLLFQISSLLLFFHWKEKYSMSLSKSSFSLLFLLGLFCGFGMGIKLINLFIVLVLIALIWWVSNSWIGLIGILVLSIAILILAGIDELSGLQVYHMGYKNTAIACVALAISLLLFSFISERKKFYRNIIFSAFMSFGLIFMFTPWVAKNYLESDKLGVKNLIMGNGSGPNVGSYYDLLRRYNESKKK